MSDSVRPRRRQPTRLPRPWDSPGKNTGVGCHFLLQCMKVKSESEVAQSCPTLATPWTAAYQAPPSMGFSRQKYWSGVLDDNGSRETPAHLCCSVRRGVMKLVWWNQAGRTDLTFIHAPSQGFPFLLLWCWSLVPFTLKAPESQCTQKHGEGVKPDTRATPSCPSWVSPHSFTKESWK